jgi:TonB family protein
MSRLRDNYVSFGLTKPPPTPKNYVGNYKSKGSAMKHAIASIFSTLLAAASLSAGSETVSLQASVLPEYPREARELNVQGVVVIEALIDETGKVFATDVICSPADQLSTAAVAAVQEWTFSPALKNGHPVVQVVRIPIEFNLNDPLRDSVMAAGNQAIASR